MFKNKVTNWGFTIVILIFSSINHLTFILECKSLVEHLNKNLLSSQVSLAFSLTGSWIKDKSQFSVQDTHKNSSELLQKQRLQERHIAISPLAAFPKMKTVSFLKRISPVPSTKRLQVLGIPPSAAPRFAPHTSGFVLARGSWRSRQTFSSSSFSLEWILSLGSLLCFSDHLHHRRSHTKSDLMVSNVLLFDKQQDKPQTNWPKCLLLPIWRKSAQGINCFFLIKKERFQRNLQKSEASESAEDSFCWWLTCSVLSCVFVAISLCFLPIKALCLLSKLKKHGCKNTFCQELEMQNPKCRIQVTET